MTADAPRVHFPESAATSRVTGPAFGYAHEDTGHVNVVAVATPPRRGLAFRACEPLGVVVPTRDAIPSDAPPLVGWYEQDGLHVTYQGVPAEIEMFDLVSNVFSRNTGILELHSMLGKGVLISGCGSVGSQVAMDLCRAGVGRFFLIDQDILAYHNLSRHQCSAVDVGRYKVDALRDRILDVNPRASIVTHQGVVQRAAIPALEEFCTPGTVIVGAADNREADVYANRIACNYRIPMVSIGLWERAFAGEIFYTIPGEMACYNCVFGGGDSPLSARPSRNRRIYTDQEDLAAIDFQPGIATDIGFVTIIGVKLAIDLLHHGDPGFRPRLLDCLTQFTLVCNTTDRQIGGEMVELFDQPLQVTRSIEVCRADGCRHCALVRDRETVGG